MCTTPATLREHARAIWDAAVAAARPQPLIHDAFNDPRLPIRDAIAAYNWLTFNNWVDSYY